MLPELPVVVVVGAIGLPVDLLPVVVVVFLACV